MDTKWFLPNAASLGLQWLRGRSYGFKIAMPSRGQALLQCPMCDSQDVTVEASYPDGGGGPRINNAFCERCPHVGQATVSPGLWPSQASDDSE